MQRFSIIVPMVGDTRLFDDTLASLLRYRPDDCQILVAHDGTYEDPYGLEGEVEFVSTQQRAQLVRFLNCGLRSATGEIIAVIRPGVALDEGWHEPVEAAFEDHLVGSVTPILTMALQPEMMVAAGVAKGFGFRRKIVGNNTKIAPRTIRRINAIGPTSWAAFYRRSALDQVGTLDEQLDPHFVDLDLALSLKQLGYRNELCPDCVVTVERSHLVTRELTLPHGRSAQRSVRRHLKSSSALSSVFNFVSEIATSPFQPWQIQHAIQRLGAMRLADIDNNFADQLSIQARQNKRQAALGLHLHESGQAIDSIGIDSNGIDTNIAGSGGIPSVRRAA